MLRKITVDIGRFRAGQQHDYPRDVWNKIAHDAGQKLSRFSMPVEDNPVHQSSLKGKPQAHKRLGSTA